MKYLIIVLLSMPFTVHAQDKTAHKKTVAEMQAQLDAQSEMIEILARQQRSLQWDEWTREDEARDKQLGLDRGDGQ